MNRRIAIIGAGPTGLEAALAARTAGFTATVYERGSVADSVKRWGHIRLFSPFSWNASPAGQALLQAEGVPLPSADDYLTGEEFAAAYLEPLAERLNVLTESTVLSIVRESSGKRDKIGEPERADTPFRLTVEHHGLERHEHADIVLDCSGLFQNPNPLGDSGAPALGEAAARRFIHYGIAETSDLSGLAGRRVLVTGAGHSAANLIVSLTELKTKHPETEIHWAIRGRTEVPCPLIPDDPLVERDRICAAANNAAASGKVILHPGTVVTALTPTGDSLRVSLRTSNGSETLTLDRVFAATGYRPDWSFARELHLQTCWATEGTYPLAASLLSEGGGGGNCLAVAAQGIETLLHPEPGYYALGMKSYGRSPGFHIATGLQQIQALFDHLAASTTPAEGIPANLE